MTIKTVLEFIFKFLPSLYFSIVKAVEEIQTSILLKENKDAIRESDEKQDQRPIEKLINPDNAGELSGRTDTEIRDSLPNVK